MSIRVALHHRTAYTYDRLVTLSPQTVRLRPAPHARTPINSYSMKVTPAAHFCNWQQDPQSNYQARLVFPEKVKEFVVEIDLVATMDVINPFDFFLEPGVEKMPFDYDEALREELAPFRVLEEPPANFAEYVQQFKPETKRTIDFLVEVNQQLWKDIRYLIRLEPGVQSCEQTLAKRSGSCRDSAWLLVQLLRHLGFAARFVSGYLIQLKADVKSLDGPSGAEQDFTDLHAWTEVYLPGAGWIGLDPTSGLLTGEGHIPLAATPEPTSAAPITGFVDECEVEFGFEMSVKRIHEDPRVTLPYTREQWEAIEALGHKVDEVLARNKVNLTMGGEPTFVSIDDMDGPEWNTTANSVAKRQLAGDLIRRLKKRFAPGGFLHFGQGKWYPGESLPRWALGCYWRRDGVPLWERADLIADERVDYGFGELDALQFIQTFAQILGVQPEHAIPAFEDTWYYLWKERKLPTNVDPFSSRLDDKEERERLARVFEQGLDKLIGYALPVQKGFGGWGPDWMSGAWFLRQERMYLIPGDSAMGLRLPLDSLPWWAPADRLGVSIEEADPSRRLAALPDRDQLRRRVAQVPRREVAGDGGYVIEQELGDIDAEMAAAAAYVGRGPGGPGRSTATPERLRRRVPPPLQKLPDDYPFPAPDQLPVYGQSAPWVVRTALCVEPRHGRLYAFLPPVRTLEDYLELVTAIEETARTLNTPVLIEGYPPPNDPRVNHLKVTPDPGVIEVNIQPAHSWDEMVQITKGVYEDAHYTRLGTEKFQLDGRHSGTGGGNHVVMGGPYPSASPFLRRPDLLKSLVGYWNNHPSLSYLFSGLFIGPTSQAPRVDEARNDAIHELELAFSQVPEGGNIAPWLVDRIFRNILVDVSGNTHRAEFCIDKMYSPESSSGRLGLLEFRAFEMPPHAEMSLTQQLLLCTMVAHFWNNPYRAPLARWGTELHDRFMLPHFVWQDFGDVIDEMRGAGVQLDQQWFAPHYEFRFPRIGTIQQRDITLEVRQAIEPWHVLGEEGAVGGTVRYVDSSLERVQVKVQGMVDKRHVVMVNGKRVPLHPTGTNGEFVAGVRYRAWRPPEALHPTIPIHAPLVFDLVDTWNGRSIGGCTYYVSHPGGRSYDTFPVNAFEAESRRGNRFYAFGHTPGPMGVPPATVNPEFPLSLDMRWG